LSTVLSGVASTPGGPGGLGISLSHPELSAWSDSWRPKLSTLKNPVKKLPFTDSGLIGNPFEKDPDKWVEVPNQQALYWRVPTNQGYYNDVPQRPVGRHNKRCNGGFADGHAEGVKTSAIGLQFYPGKSPDGKTATGIQWLGGNGLYDDRWMWSVGFVSSSSLILVRDACISACAVFVAQIYNIYNLLYRRIVFCRTLVELRALIFSCVQQIKNLRYSRVQLCASWEKPRRALK
jgi:prepilin-type processing-associated H-X9-DG protein